MGAKNISDSFQQHITDTIRKVHQSEKPKKLMPEYKQTAFRDLCILQMNSDPLAYQIYLKAFLKRI